jgi:hydroxymethylpyrimidine/phosphomethylpyrimidine kinase
MSARGEIPIALTIAGSDSSAGAGAQADLKTFGALGVYGLTAITCVVAETPGKVLSIHAVPADVVAEQVLLLLENLPACFTQRKSSRALQLHCAHTRRGFPWLSIP